MARYEFKLPDIGEGIAEAEVVAWHVKVGDTVEEDQPLADMMTDKATVEMESPVAGKVIAVAGEVGDQIAIGSVLVVFETSAEAAEAAAEAEETGAEAALADGLVDVTEGLEEAVPSADVEEPSQTPKPFAPSEVEGRTSGSVQRASTTLGTNEAGGEKKILASPAVRQRARSRYRSRPGANHL